MKWTLGKCIIFAIVLFCFGTAVAQDTAWVELRYQDADVWDYHVNPSSKIDVYVYSNTGIKGCSFGFKMNRRVINIDTVYLGDSITAPIQNAEWENDSIFASGDTLSYFILGAVEFLNPTIFTTGDTVLLGTVEISFIEDSMPHWADNPLDWGFDSTKIGAAGDFTFTLTAGTSLKPTAYYGDTTTLYKNIGVSDIRPDVLPLEFELSQNFPNPFNPTTVIEFAVPSKSMVNLDIYNVMGQKVRTLVDEELDVGWKSVTWDGKDDAGNAVASGIYLYRVEAGNYVDSKKMMMLK